MTSIITPYKKNELYRTYLQEISGVKFTFREIDIISCIVHNRGDKKIASSLLISHRTVGAHVYNIMGKIGCNSKEDVIDFVEKSGKLQYLRQYYFQLVVQSCFEKQLRKISALINRNIISYFVDFNSTDERELQLFSYLENHLKIANIHLVRNKEQQTDCNIYIIGKELGANNKEISKKDIILLLDKNQDISAFNNIKSIDLCIDTEYYFNVFKIIKKLLEKDKLEQIIQEFETEYANFQLSWKGADNLLQRGSKLFKLSKGKKIFLLFIISFAIAGSCLFLYSKYSRDNITKTNEECSEFIKSFSFENIGITKGLKNNIDYLKKIDVVISNLDHQSMIDYFKKETASKKELLNYLYSLHAVGMNALYNQYDELKARKLLENAKSAIENYVIKQYNTQINFNELSPEEVYMELSIIDSFPETYARILYLLGRTHTYFEEYNRSNQYLLPRSIDTIQRYYTLSEYIGNKSKLFESALSIRNGTEMVRLLKIKAYLQNGEDQKASREIIKSIDILEKLRKDNNEYILDYRPDGNVKTIIPKLDNYWKLFVTEQIINHYARLIKITENNNQRSKYIGIISSYCFGNKEIVGVFNEIEQVPPKKIACLYNSLGYILLQFVEQDIDFTEFSVQIKKKLDIKANDDLELIAELFNLASTKSRNSYYSKADSYDGLIKTYKEKLARQNRNMNKQNIEALKKQIHELSSKRDKLNQQLKRRTVH